MISQKRQIVRNFKKYGKFTSNKAKHVETESNVAQISDNGSEFLLGKMYFTRETMVFRFS